jgi:hypothetical protein
MFILLIGMISMEFTLHPPKFSNANCSKAKDQFRHYAGAYTLDTFYMNTKQANKDKAQAVKIVLYAHGCFPTSLVENARTGG